MNLYQTDPEFMELSENFAYKEVAKDESVRLDDRTRYLAILATCIGAGGKEEFSVILDKALDDGIDPVAVKECVYQAVDYLGLARMREFLSVTNPVMTSHGIILPLPSQKTTDETDRFEKGLACQVEFFGEGMRESVKSGLINRWLAANCFGDYYTRTGLSAKEREMITFCFLLAQGGCEPQLMGHCLGNFNVGNDEAFLMKVVHNVVPYIGYPRSLNAISVIKKASEKNTK